MKPPPVQYTDDVARDMVEEFIRGDSIPLKKSLTNLSTSSGPVVEEESV